MTTTIYALTNIDGGITATATTDTARWSEPGRYVVVTVQDNTGTTLDRFYFADTDKAIAFAEAVAN
jgi:hypothetical protein